MNRPIPVRAIVFDLDGTLVDSGRDIALAANHVRTALGREELPLDRVLDFIGDGVPVLLRRILGADGPEPDAAALARARAIFDARYRDHCLDHTRPFPGVAETLAALASVPLMVATNKPAAFTGPMLAGLDLARWFRRTVSGDEVPAKKPAPDMILAALAGLDVDPADVAVVGDSLNDLRAARAVGALAVGCTFGLRPAAEIRAAGADAVAERFADLASILAPAA